MSNIEYLILTLLFIIVIFVIVYLYISNKDLKTKINVLELKNKKYKIFHFINEFLSNEGNNISNEVKEYFLTDILKFLYNNNNKFYIENTDKLLLQAVFMLVLRFNIKYNILQDINIEYKTNNNILTFKIK